MSKHVVLPVMGVLLLLASGWAQDADQQVSVMRSLTSIPLAFTENQGQWDERVLFRANANGATMWFTTDGVYYQFTRRVSKDEADVDERPDLLHDRLSREWNSVETLIVKSSFVGANPSPRVMGAGPVGVQVQLLHR